MLEKSPETVKSIEVELKESIEKSEKLIEKGYSAILSEEEKTSGDNTKAILKIIKEKYNKKLETDDDVELALKLYENMVAAKSAKTLIDKTPNTIKDIKPELEELVSSSDEIVRKTLPVLK